MHIPFKVLLLLISICFSEGIDKKISETVITLGEIWENVLGNIPRLAFGTLEQSSSFEKVLKTMFNDFQDAKSMDLSKNVSLYVLANIISVVTIVLPFIIGFFIMVSWCCTQIFGGGSKKKYCCASCRDNRKRCCVRCCCCTYGLCSLISIACIAVMIFAVLSINFTVLELLDNLHGCANDMYILADSFESASNVSSRFRELVNETVFERKNYISDDLTNLWDAVHPLINSTNIIATYFANEELYNNYFANFFNSSVVNADFCNDGWNFLSEDLNPWMDAINAEYYIAETDYSDGDYSYLDEQLSHSRVELLKTTSFTDWVSENYTSIKNNVTSNYNEIKKNITQLVDIIMNDNLCNWDISPLVIYPLHVPFGGFTNESDEEINVTLRALLDSLNTSYCRGFIDIISNQSITNIVSVDTFITESNNRYKNIFINRTNDVMNAISEEYQLMDGYRVTMTRGDDFIEKIVTTYKLYGYIIVFATIGVLGLLVILYFATCVCAQCIPLDSLLCCSVVFHNVFFFLAGVVIVVFTFIALPVDDLAISLDMSDAEGQKLYDVVTGFSEVLQPIMKWLDAQYYKGSDYEHRILYNCANVSETYSYKFCDQIDVEFGEIQDEEYYPYKSSKKIIKSNVNNSSQTSSNIEDDSSSSKSSFVALLEDYSSSHESSTPDSLADLVNNLNNNKLTSHNSKKNQEDENLCDPLTDFSDSGYCTDMLHFYSLTDVDYGELVRSLFSVETVVNPFDKMFKLTNIDFNCIIRDLNYIRNSLYADDNLNYYKADDLNATFDAIKDTFYQTVNVTLLNDLGSLMVNPIKNELRYELLTVWMIGVPFLVFLLLQECIVMCGRDLWQKPKDLIEERNKNEKYEWRRKDQTEKMFSLANFCPCCCCFPCCREEDKEAQSGGSYSQYSKTRQKRNAQSSKSSGKSSGSNKKNKKNK